MDDFKPLFNNVDELTELISIKHLPPDTKHRFIDYCRKNMRVFSKHLWDIGRSKSTTAYVELTTNEEVTQRFYPIPQNAQKEVEEILNELEKNNVIREAKPNEKSQFVNCLLITNRKSGKKRVLLDARLANIYTRTIPAHFSMNFEVISSIPKGTVAITTLDISSAFFCIPTDEDSQHCFSFYDHRHRKYMFQVCPQGLKNSPYFLQQTLLKALKDIKNVVFLADDIVTFSTISIDDNINTVMKIIERLNEEGLKLSPKKLSIAQTSVEILGIQYSMGSLSIPESRVQRFLDYKIPRSFKDVKRFLGAVSFYRYFLKNFSKESLSLLSLANKANIKESSQATEKLVWLPEHQHAFDNIKQMILNHTKTCLPDFKKEYWASVDASKYAIGCFYTRNPKKVE